MTKRLRIGLFLFAALALILLAVGGIAMSRIEQGKAGRCYRDGSTPTPEELRARMMRNLLLAEMEVDFRIKITKTIRHLAGKKTKVFISGMDMGDSIDEVRFINNVPAKIRAGSGNLAGPPEPESWARYYIRRQC